MNDQGVSRRDEPKNDDVDNARITELKLAINEFIWENGPDDMTLGEADRVAHDVLLSLHPNRADRDWAKRQKSVTEVCSENENVSQYIGELEDRLTEALADLS